MYNSENKLHRYFNLMLCLIFLFIFTSLSGYGQITNYISAALLVCILPACIRFIPSDMIKEFVCLAFFLVFYFITSVTNYSSLYYLIGTCVLYTLIVFGPYFIHLYFQRKENKNLKKNLFIFSTVVWFIIVSISVYTYYGTDIGGREYASEHKGALLGGGYSAAYASGLLAVLLFNYLLSSRKWNGVKVKALLIAGTLMSVLHVFFTMSTITIIAMLLGMLLSFFFHGQKTNKTTFGGVLFAVLLIGFAAYLLFNQEKVGHFLIKYSGSINNDLLSARMNEVGRLLYENEESHHMGNRIYTLTISIKTFFENPLFGVGYKYGNNYTMLYQNGVGVHSEFLDSFAKHGIVGAIPFLYFFYSQFKRLISSSKYRFALPVVATFAMMFIFNPFLSVQTIFMISLYMPLLLSIIEKQK